MSREHAISDEVLEIIQLAIDRNENWMAYNNSLYFIDKEDVQFFNEKRVAEEFVSNNCSDCDHYNLINVQSLVDVFRLIPYGEELTKKLNNLSSKNLSTMSELELAFVENQFKKIGLSEVFTPELVNKLKSGDAQINHSFTKLYGGDEARADFHLRKGESSNLYFLNKYDLSVRKDGQTNEVSKTFYLNNFKRRPGDDNQTQDRYYTTFTFKAAFNYLSGRPVFNTYKNQNGEQYKSWDVLNTKKVLENGKMEEKHYHENYGFNLENALKNYSIKELVSNEYKEKLLQSLQRGNLQSVTFIGGDGKTEKLFISPDIALGAMKVYDENKTRLTTQVLVEKGYIGKELAEKIQQRIESIVQNGKQSRKQEKITKDEGPQKEEPEKPKQAIKENKQKREKLNDASDKKQNKRQRHKIQ